MLGTLMRSRGHDVIDAESGEQAVAILARTRPDLVIADIRMPGIDGFDLARRIRDDATLGNLPVIFYTALPDDPGDDARAASLGVDAVVHKNGDVGVLLTAIGRALPSGPR